MHGADDPVAKPAEVPGLDDIVQASTSLVHTCALRADGAVFCWGANSHGQLGNGSEDKSTTPVAVVGYP